MGGVSGAAPLWDYNVYDPNLCGGDVGGGEVPGLYAVARYPVEVLPDGLRQGNYQVAAEVRYVYSPDELLDEDRFFDSDDPELPWFVALLDWEDAA